MSLSHNAEMKTLLVFSNIYGIGVSVCVFCEVCCINVVIRCILMVIFSLVFSIPKIIIIGNNQNRCRSTDAIFIWISTFFPWVNLWHDKAWLGIVIQFKSEHCIYGSHKTSVSFILWFIITISSNQLWQSEATN